MPGLVRAARLGTAVAGSAVMVVALSGCADQSASTATVTQATGSSSAGPGATETVATGPLAAFKSCLAGHGITLDQGSVKDALANGTGRLSTPAGVSEDEFDAALGACADQLPDQVDPAQLGIDAG